MWRAIAVLCVILTCSGLPARAAKKALVIGNGAYVSLEPLRNTRPDAEGYRDVFAQLGYEVHFHTDLDELALEEAVISFVDGILPGDEIAFVYSGHGWSADGINYLIPVDAPKQGSERLLARRSLALKNGVNGVLDDIAAQGAGLSLAIIDACRDNPFASNGTRSVGSTRGLARVAPRKGSFVIYSAGEGQTALDRLPSDTPDQRYSVFTRHFLPLLSSDLYIEDAISEAQLRVSMAAETQGHQQQPAYYDQTLGKTCLNGTCRGTVPDAAPQSVAWFVERAVPEEVYLFGARAPLVSAQGDRIYWPVTTQKGTQVGARKYGETVEVFDGAGKRLSAFVPDGNPQSYGLTPSGKLYILGSDGHVHFLTQTGGVTRRVALSQLVDLVDAEQMLTSGKLRVKAMVGDRFDEAIADLDPETGVVSKPVWKNEAFVTSVRMSASGQFGYQADGQIQVFDRDGTPSAQMSVRTGDWRLVDFDVSPLGVFELQAKSSSATKGIAQFRFRQTDWLGSVVELPFEVPVSPNRAWEVLSMTADAQGVVVIAVLDATTFEVLRFDAFGERVKWRAELPWDRTAFGPPIGVTQLSDGGVALVQYPYLPDGVTDKGDVLRLTRIGPNGEIPSFR